MVKPPMKAPDSEPIENILGSPSTPEELAKWAAIDRDWEIFQVLLACLAEDYEKSNINIDDLMRLATDWEDNFVGLTGETLPDRGATRAFGNLMKRVKEAKLSRNAHIANKLDPNELPPSIQKLIADLVEKAAQHGKQKVLKEYTTGHSAFEHVADLMDNYGIKVKESTVSAYYYKHYPRNIKQ